MSPEQLNFEVPTHKSDIFSAGITLAQLVTGKHPFASIDSNEPIEQRIKEFEPNLIGLSDLQRNVCKALLQKDPSLRPNASQVIEEFKLRIPLLPRKFMKKSIPVKTPPIKKDVDKKREVGNIHDPVLEGLVGEIETNKLIPEILVKPKKKYITPHYRKERQKLADVLKIFLTKHSEKVFKIRFFSRVFNTEIYFQGYTDENSNLLAEAMSDKFLSMKFNLTDLKKMSELGFRSPTNENPNYFITLPKNESNISLIAKMIADALFDIYEGSHFSEIFLNQMTSETTKEILVKTGVTVAGDGSFKIGSLQKLKSATDQYQKWQVIGLVERNSPYGYVLKKVMARHIENNRIHERTNNSAWLFKGVDSNPFSTVAAESSMLKGLVFNKKVITLFDQSNKEDRELNFEHIRSFIDFVPTLSDKYLEEEKANPLTNEMIKLAEISKKDHDFSDYLSMEFEEGLSLFTLTSSEFDNDLVLGLFAKHPITNKFYGRKNGEWKLLFESPLRYGFSVSFVTKEFIDLFDRRSKLPNKPIRWEEMERLGFLYE
jgi:serine/threonine protein kinase